MNDFQIPQLRPRRQRPFNASPAAVMASLDLRFIAAYTGVVTSYADRGVSEEDLLRITHYWICTACALDRPMACNTGHRLTYK